MHKRRLPLEEPAEISPQPLRLVGPGAWGVPTELVVDGNLKRVGVSTHLRNISEIVHTQAASRNETLQPTHLLCIG